MLSAKAPSPNNLSHLSRDKGYRFRPQDPDMEFITNLISKSGFEIHEIQEKILDLSNNTVNIAYGTIYNWQMGKTRRPQNFTLTWVARALGYERDWKRIK